MPSRFVVRSFAENYYYHVFNRGVEKRKVFEDEQDYKIFMYYLFIYLTPLEIVLKKYPKLRAHLRRKNLSKELELAAYCLMPNHFHFLLRQKTATAISKFLKQLMNAYTQYFNTRYKRTGGLMEGRFKAVLIDSDDLLLHVSRYIHLNPIVANLVKDLRNYKWSSYPSYIGLNKNNFCEKETILSNFSSIKSFEQFTLDQIDYAKELERVKYLAIDSEA